MSPKIGLIVAAVAATLGAAPAVALAKHGHSSRSRGHSSRSHTDSTVTGTVSSFAGGVLGIKRADGTVVTATVSSLTKIECEPVAADADDMVVDRSHGSDDNGVETSEPVAGGDDAGTTTVTGAACDQTALVPGAAVTRARIRDNGSGPVFKQIRLAL